MGYTVFMVIFETGIFFFSVVAIIVLITVWTNKIRENVPAEEWSTALRVRMYVFPRIALVWAVIVLIFLVSDINKIYLIFILPITYFAFAYVMRERFKNEEPFTE